ncbi:hypothetical protein M8J75_010200 [Diaphorina citri]|nr:hypothetical protein M8J75_010200 [Diaphorina citri]
MLQFGYIGTQFSGVQRQIPNDFPNSSDVMTVQGLLEHALSFTRPLNEVNLRISSRTDAGVHAFKSTADVDLEYRYEHQHNPYSICKVVNNFFKQSDLDIRLHDLIHVPNNFSARFQAQWRKYIYRVAVIREPKYQGSSHNFFIPMTEHNRCNVLLNHPFVGIDAAKECGKMVEGTHDFATFMSKCKLTEVPPINTKRTINSFDISPGRSFFGTEWDYQFDYWTFTCVGRAFLYKQVRKLVSAMIGVAQEVITVDEFRYMLENPSTLEVDNWHRKLNLVPPYGLYLMDIGYREEDLRVPKDNIRYALVIESVQDPKKLEVIKLFRELHGSCSILQARDMLANTPVAVRKDLILLEAKHYQGLFEEAQCTTRIEKIELDGEDHEHSEDRLKSSNLK